MDPLAHTLIGATIAETPLSRRTPLARVTLMVAANLPDIDATCMVLGRDVSLGFRRGHTHGVLAMLVLPIVLTGLVVWFDRRLRRPKGRAPVDARWVLALSFIGVLSHPALDWLNNYGVRLLMPFSGEWFYGDAVFIIDPWLWLLAASAVVLRNSSTRRAVAGWIVLGVLCSALVLSTTMVPLGVKVAWVLGVAGIVVLRRWGPPSETVAVAALSLMAVYVGAAIGLSAYVRGEAREHYASRGVSADLVVVGPVAGRPLVRDVIVRAGGVYHFSTFDLAAASRFTEGRSPQAMNDGPIARRGLALRPGLETWIRLPAFEVTPIEGGHEVQIGDVRYDRRGAGLGRARVVVPGSR